MYNVLLDRKSSIVVNDVVCVALGHGLSGEGVEHEFWGNWDRVVGAFKEVDSAGFENGRVIVGGMVRDKGTRRVMNFSR